MRDELTIERIRAAAARIQPHVLRAVIVMPSDATPIKLAAVRADGAEVVLVGPDSDERSERAQEIARAEGLVPVEPYDDLDVAAGQGTAALELLEDAGHIDRFYAPVGGGGLMAGSAVVMRALTPQTEIVGIEPEDAGDTRLSLERGERTSVPPPATLADGLRVRRPGALRFPIVQALVSRIELVSDEELLDAIAYALGSLRLVLEPSGAASLALALREGAGRCGVLLSGGNVDRERLTEAARRMLGERKMN